MGYVRQTGIEAVKHEALVMELANKQNGRVTRENVIELLNISAPQAYRLLKRLADNGKLELIGSGRNAYYLQIE